LLASSFNRLADQATDWKIFSRKV